MKKQGPQRIQLSRAKGWRMPPNTVKVDRTTFWGNMYPVGPKQSAEQAVAKFKAFVGRRPELISEFKSRLRGKNLACWCKPGAPCHADVLLEIANGEI